MRVQDQRQIRENQTYSFQHFSDHSNKPCLLLLDINMPLMSGWEFLEAISIRPYAELAFVIIVSSSVDASDHKKGKQFRRVVGYLEKPIDAKALNDFRLSDRYPRLMERD